MQVIPLCAHTHTYINLLFFRFFSISSYKILSRVACAVTDALVGHLFSIQWCVSANPKLLIYLPPLSTFGNHKFVFFICVSISVLCT